MKRKIIFFNRFYAPDFSATSQILTVVAEGLAEQVDLNVEVVCSRLTYDGQKVEGEPVETLNGVTVNRLWSSRFGRGSLVGRIIDYISFYISAIFYCLFKLKPGHIYVVKTDPPMLMSVIVFYLRLKKGITVIWHQDIYPETAIYLGVPILKGRVGGLIVKIRNFSFKRVTYNVVISEAMKRHLLSNGVPAEKISIIENFIDERKVKPIAINANSLRSEWGFKDTDFVIGYSGNLGRAHDLNTMMDAAVILKSYKDIKFLFIGGGHLRSALEAESKRLGLNNIITKPYQPFSELSKSLSVADVHWLSLRPELEGLIMPSKFYGIAAVARPMIFVGNKEGDIGGLCSEYNIGLSVEPGDSEGFAQAVLKLQENIEDREQMGVFAYKMIHEERSQGQRIDQWKHLCSEFSQRLDKGL